MITYNVTITLTEQDGSALSGASVAVLLDKPDIDSVDGYITPKSKTFTTDVNGQAVMALWPNDRGSEGSVYSVTVTHPTSGDILFTATMLHTSADENFYSIATIYNSPALQPFPAADPTREDRVADDLADFVKAGTDTTRIKRWLVHVLNIAKRGRRWWFLENIARTELDAGADIIDLKGDIDRVISLYAPGKLTKVDLQTIVDARADAIENNRPNAGPVKIYALEAGKRVHLWPAPEERIKFWVYYTRPMDIQIVPPEWDTLLMDGVIGIYARHFDRDSLVSDPQIFENRFYQALKESMSDHFDVERLLRDFEVPHATTTLGVQSASELSTGKTVPASLTGIGNEAVYNFVVG